MPGKVIIVLEAQDKEALARIREFGRGVQDTVDKLKASQPALEGTRVKVTQLTSAKVDAFKAAQQWQGALVLLPGQLGSVASQATSLATALRGPAGLAVGIGLVVGAGLSLVKSLANDIERLDNLSRQTGLAVSSLQAFEQAAREAGEAPDTLIQGLGRVNQAINDVLMGAPNAGKAFKAIGVDLRALVRDGASTETILEATARALAAIPDPTARAAAQMELFGTRGRAMSTVLDAIAQKSLPGYVDELKTAGIVTSEETNRMARDIDKLADEFDRLWTGMVNRAKAAAVEIVQTLRRAADPSAVFGVMPGEIEGPAAIERSPPQDAAPRTLALSPEENAAEDFRLKHEIAANQAIAQDREALAGALAAIDDRERAARLASEQATQAALAGLQIAAIEAYEQRQNALQAADDAARAARLAGEVETARQMQALDAEVQQAISAEHARTQQEQLQFIASTSTGRLHALEAEREQIRTLLDKGVLDVQAAEDAKLRIKELTIARDLELEARKVDRGLELEIAGQEQMNRLLELRVTAEQRARLAILRGHELTAQASGNAWGVFSARFQQEAASWGTTMQQFGDLGAGVARSLNTAFEESFFQLMKGNLDDFDDIWKGFLDAILREIAKFLAAAAVKELITFIQSLGNLNVGGAGGGGGGGSTSSTTDDVTKWGTAVASVGTLLFTQQKQQVELEQQATNEASKRLILEQQRSSALGLDIGPVGGGAVTGGKIGGVIGGVTGIGSLPGMVVGAIVGAAIAMANAQREAAFFSAAMAKVAMHSQAATAQVEALTAAQVALGPELDLSIESTVGLTTATTDLTAAQTDLAISTADVVGSVGSLTDSLGDLGKAAQDADKATSDAIKGINDTIDSMAPPAPGTPGGGPQPSFGPGGAFTGGGPADPGVPTGPSIAASGGGPGAGPGGVGAGASPGAAAGDSTGYKQRRRDAAAILADTQAAVAAALDLANAWADTGTALATAQALTARLALDVASTVPGVADMGLEAQHLAEALASGVVPTATLVDAFSALSREHGPGFVEALISAVEQLGLSHEQAQAILDAIRLMAEGVEVPVNYVISVSGSPPPGVGSPVSPGGSPIITGGVQGGGPNFQHGLLEGPLPSTGWFFGHQGELVSTVDQGRAILQALERSARGDPQDRALMVQQNALLREQNAILRELARGRGRVVGAAV